MKTACLHKTDAKTSCDEGSSQKAISFGDDPFICLRGTSSASAQSCFDPVIDVCCQSGVGDGVLDHDP